ncbi:hypothetical protein [Nostoc sp.]|uniref:hypothetical protein n=1 Tax=Nostoc sp. TaxID=1180 RepID=UPI002FF8008C
MISCPVKDLSLRPQGGREQGAGGREQGEKEFSDFCTDAGIISSPLNHLRYVIASGTEWNEAITSLRDRCLHNEKYLGGYDITWCVSLKP